MTAKILIRLTLGYLLFPLFLTILSGIAYPQDLNLGRIRPYVQNINYWQYKGEPVLLLGGSKNDNLFQIQNLEQHLEDLAMVGGNYIRNTMSSRDSGDVHPFLPLANGKYDLDQWNPAYWLRFENLLKWTHQRDIIIQIEIWDRFDFSQDFWQGSPWNPKNNINYTAEQTDLQPVYPKHPSRDLQPFFHSIPGMPRYGTELDLIRKYQEKFVDRILKMSLKYGNVLYCMDNETSTPPQWGLYWINYIRAKATGQGLSVYLTDMFDNFYKPQSCDICQEVIKDPEFYSFLDISQINSRNFGQNHWDTLQWIREKVRPFPRPINNTKIYGGGESSWGSGTAADGIERFCRNILGGCASARFHRPTSGSGLKPISKGVILSFRKVETVMKLWDLEPDLALLSDREPNEAYIAGNQSRGQYLLYFPDGGSVHVNLPGNDFILRWIRVSSGDWHSSNIQELNGPVRITTPESGGWLGLINRINGQP